MYKKKQKQNKSFIITLVFLIIAILLVASFTIKDDREISLFEKLIKDSSNLITNLMGKPVSDLKKQESDIESIDKIKAEKEELEKEIDELKKTLEMESTLSEYDPISAVVCSRNIGYWFNTFTIDKGSTSEIENDMAVVNNKGLVGRTIKVSNLYSEVKLLTDESFNGKISVKVKTKDGYAYGLLSGFNKDNNSFKIEGIAHNEQIENNALVTTTGMGSIFPSGILIGKVINSTTDNFDLARILEAKSDVDFNDISIVSVLKRNVN